MVVTWQLPASSPSAVVMDRGGDVLVLVVLVPHSSAAPLPPSPHPPPPPHLRPPRRCHHGRSHGRGSLAFVPTSHLYWLELVPTRLCTFALACTRDRSPLSAIADARSCSLALSASIST
jgi:hypothetical protein